MSIKALQDYTYSSKYARYNQQEGRRETWNEAVDRVKEMHVRRYPQVAEDIEWAFDLVKQKRVLGSQRALQFGGEPIEKKNARIYNCTSSYCNRIRFFQECFWLLLCGCGTGFSVQKHHIAKLPLFHKQPRDKEKIFIIPDTIEGWSDSLGILLATYLPHPEFRDWKGYNVIFDYSQIRPAGSFLSSGAGKAPGHSPLEKALDTVRVLLDECVERGQRRLRPIDAYDIVMHTSDAVLSGGVRRSATICIFSPEDEEMRTAKIGNWRETNPQRGRSNNSALLIRNKTTKEQFLELLDCVKEYGEPGFLWSDNREALFNPCLTKDAIVVTNQGLSLVGQLIGKRFNALVDGEIFPSTKKGFWDNGIKRVMTLEFSSGRRLRLTPNHRLLTTAGWKKASDISFEDEIVIHNHRNFTPHIDSDSSDYAQGYCLGNFLSDGNCSKNSAQMKWWGVNKDEYRRDGISLLEQAGWKNGHHNNHNESKGPRCAIDSKKLYDFAVKKRCVVGDEKKLSPLGATGSWSYLAGLIAAYFDGDGTVNVNHKKGNSIRIASSSPENLRNLQVILNGFGIMSKIYWERRPAGPRTLPDGSGGVKVYECKADHELIISSQNILRFSELIPIRNYEKIEKIKQIIEGYKRTPNRTHFIDQVINKKVEEEERVYDCEISEIHAFDANGVYSHNCGEVGLYAYDDDGNPGWEFCNLCEINGKKIKCKEDFALAARAAGIIGTLQAGYTDFDYLGPVTKSIVEREALLGVSITGMMDNPDVLFHSKTQKEMAKLILTINEWMAKKIGINPCARATCVKPAGTSSLVLGSASGIHPHHAKRYLRRVQANSLEPVFQYFKSFNPFAVEKCGWSANETDEVITFTIEVPAGAKTKNDLSAIEFLETVRETQKNWVTAGRRANRCTQNWLQHNVSNTIQVDLDEWDGVANYIYKNRKYFAGITLIPASGDLDYPQAPMVNVLTPREVLQRYGDGSLLASGLVVDGIHAFDDLWLACDSVLGKSDPPIEPVRPNGNSTLDDHRVWEQEHQSWELKMDWVRRVKQFAERYCNDDVRQCTYLMKHVHVWKLWLDLRREYVDVDYVAFREETDVTKPMEAIACAGGCCELSL